MKLPRGSVPGLLLCTLPTVVWSQVRLGAEMQVNAYTTGAQRRAAVAVHGAGGFVVAWMSPGQDGSDDGIFGQRFDASGGRQGAEFQVNSWTTNRQRDPNIAWSPAGMFVAVWSSDGQDGDGYGLFGQRFDASGNPEGAEFQINAHTTGDQRAFRSSVVWPTNDSFVVTWASADQDGSDYGIFAQRFNGSGQPQGGEFRVNSYTTGRQRRMDIAADADGNFVVVWDGVGQDGSQYGVFGQRYDPSGAPRGGEFQVNSYTTGYQFDPSVDVTPAGDFVVTWSSHDQDGSLFGVFGQRYDASGSPRGGEFQVNAHVTSHQYVSSVATRADGGFVVVWNSFGQDGSVGGIFGQHHRASGARVGGEFHVNSHTTNYQYLASVAAAASGNFVVSWQSAGQDGSGYGIFAQRFAPDLVFADGFES
jgi:hypothetical protein